jgi:O-antigen/teichoic acid export membrane protein
MNSDEQRADPPASEEAGAQERGGWVGRLQQAVGGGRLRQKVAVLAGGTSLAQVLSAVSMPVVSRLYSVSDFGVLTVITSLAHLFAIVMTFRFQVAIPLPSEGAQARDLLRTSLALAAVLGTILFVVIAGVATPLFTFLKVPEAISFWWFLPLTALGLAVYECFYHWVLRLRRYRQLAGTRLVQAVSNVGASIGLGLFREGPLGLLIGGLLFQCAGAGSLARALRVAAEHTGDAASGSGSEPAGSMNRPGATEPAGTGTRRSATPPRSWRETVRTARRFSMFALFGTPSALLNASGLLLPPLIVAALYGSEASGAFGFAFRVVSLPMSLLGVAISQVFLAEASPLMAAEPGKVQHLFRQVSRRLAPFALLLALGGLACPVLFPFVFGSRWAQAGQFAALLALSCAAQMMVSPVSNIAVLTRRQGSQLVLDVVRTAGVLLSLWLPYRWGAPVLVAVACLAGTTVVVYVGYYFFYRHLARGLRQT